MKTRPALFNGEMVKAILDNRKSQSRRVIKPQPEIEIGPENRCLIRWKDRERKIVHGRAVTLSDMLWSWAQDHCSFGIGQKLWVREAFKVEPTPNCSFGDMMMVRSLSVFYRADGARKDFADGGSANVGNAHVDFGCSLSEYSVCGPQNYGVWNPSIHMPKIASRITLEITDVRVERVQEISEQGAIAEGIRKNPVGVGEWIDYPAGTSAAGWNDPRKSFRSLWDSINAKRGHSFESNPWIWVIGFKRMIRPSFNGRTPGFDPGNEGSSPSGRSTIKRIGGEGG